MNSKKVLLVCVILIIAIFSLSMASAGLFGNNYKYNQDVCLDAKIIDSQLNYELIEEKIMKPVNNSFKQTGNYSKVKYHGYIIVNITGYNGVNLTSDEIKTLKDTLDNKSSILQLSTSLIHSIKCDDWNYTLDNNILTITFNTTYENPTHSDINGSSSGTVNITQFVLRNPSTSLSLNGVYIKPLQNRSV